MSIISNVTGTMPTVGMYTVDESTPIITNITGSIPSPINVTGSYQV